MFCGKRFLVLWNLTLKEEHLERSRKSPCEGFIEPPVFCCD